MTQLELDLGETRDEAARKKATKNFTTRDLARFFEAFMTAPDTPEVCGVRP